MYRLCHSSADPITWPVENTRATCWIGLHEKAGTGTVATPQKDQIWLWLDETTPESNGYVNWATWPGMGDGKGDGNHFFEPNNQRTSDSNGENVRHAVINLPEGGYSGLWYDQPSQTLSHALCEKWPMSNAEVMEAYQASK